jgi:hypothetical protein
MKIIFSIIIFTTLAVNVISQKKSIFHGNYEGKLTKGIVEYEYYENQYFERIYDGFFKFSSIDLNTGLNLSVVGNYKENKKNGNWVYKLTSKQLSKFNSIVSGLFNNGQLEGNWNFKRTKLIYISGRPVNETDISTCDFLNNKFIGIFKYKIGDVKIEGSFDKYGFFDNLWKVNWEIDGIPFEELRSYKNGFCYKSIYRNLSSGEIIEKFDFNDLQNAFQLENIIKDSTLILNSNNYKIEIVNKSDIDNTIYKDVYNNSYQGLKQIYRAIGFWICSNSMNCNFLMEKHDQFIEGNYIHEIYYGIENIDFAFEKKLTLINKQK